jgi:mannitol-1-phosphate 5-dehydrogenase
MIRERKIVIFGAGKIGRSFIGQLFSRGGYEVVFIDVYKPVIEELNRHKEYTLVIKSETDEIIKIKNVKGVFSGDTESVINEVATAGIAAVSVGLNGLKGVFPLLCKGLEERYRRYGIKPLDLILAENMRNADGFFLNEIKKFFSEDFPAESMIGLIETSIGKMVPVMQQKDIGNDSLKCFAEPYNTLILNKNAFKNKIPEVEGLAPKENIKAWVDRKLFIHNLGHAAVAYIAYRKNQETIYIYEALSDPEVYKPVRDSMLQAAEILRARYPAEFSKDELIEHIEDLLKRFQNKYLGDTLYRVGCDLVRKLGPEDRISGAIKAAMEYGLPYDRILNVLIAALDFRGKDENGNMSSSDINFHKVYSGRFKEVLTEVCGFSESQYDSIKKTLLSVKN